MKSNFVLILSLLYILTTSCKGKNPEIVVLNNLDSLEVSKRDTIIAKTIPTNSFLSLSHAHLDRGRGYTKFGSHNDTGDLPHHKNATSVENVTQMLDNL
ncbi:hypothetical protein [Lacinutrix sp. Bg11-31]|uniref:hypothetical protein n=1 Tax=Lacinutrix sp. Bg11-31 TaxID=2057808 RepID=UPI000C3074F8|nr:hypothetical protein [Lacinutrix sp. Bg11-31]AUC81827.1 hypothetical protein CW733_06650 [Lacinutrix sp. Bg11-31]